MDFFFYDISGRVEMELTAPNEDFALLYEKPYVVNEVAGTAATHYVDLTGLNPEVKERTPLPVGYQVDGFKVTFEDIPAGTTVELGDSRMISDEEGAEIEFDAPGTYAIELYPPPQYTDESLEVTIG